MFIITYVIYYCTATPAPMRFDSTGLAAGLVAACILVLLCITVVVICLVMTLAKKRKAAVRSLQLEVLTRSVNGAVEKKCSH